jgi:surfactin synthase thioesterase subunit
LLAVRRDQGRTGASVLIVYAEDDPVIAPRDVLAWQEVVDVRGWIRLTGGHFAVAGHVAEVVDGLLGLLPLESASRGR